MPLPLLALVPLLLLALLLLPPAACGLARRAKPAAAKAAQAVALFLLRLLASGRRARAWARRVSIVRSRASQKMRKKKIKIKIKIKITLALACARGRRAGPRAAGVAVQQSTLLLLSALLLPIEAFLAASASIPRRPCWATLKPFFSNLGLEPQLQQVVCNAGLLATSALLVLAPLLRCMLHGIRLAEALPLFWAAARCGCGSMLPVWSPVWLATGTLARIATRALVTALYGASTALYGASTQLAVAALLLFGLVGLLPPIALLCAPALARHACRRRRALMLAGLARRAAQHRKERAGDFLVRNLWAAKLAQLAGWRVRPGGAAALAQYAGERPGGAAARVIWRPSGGRAGGRWRARAIIFPLILVSCGSAHAMDAECLGNNAARVGGFSAATVGVAAAAAAALLSPGGAPGGAHACLPAYARKCNTSGTSCGEGERLPAYALVAA